MDFKAIFKGLYERVFVHYKPTLIGMAAAAGIYGIDTFTTILQGVPKPAVQAVAGVVVVIGALLKQKLQEKVAEADKVPVA